MSNKVANNVPESPVVSIKNPTVQPSLAQLLVGLGLVSGLTGLGVTATKGLLDYSSKPEVNNKDNNINLDSFRIPFLLPNAEQTEKKGQWRFVGETSDSLFNNPVNLPLALTAGTVPLLIGMGVGNHISSSLRVADKEKQIEKAKKNFRDALLKNYNIVDKSAGFVGVMNKLAEAEINEGSYKTAQVSPVNLAVGAGLTGLGLLGYGAHEAVYHRLKATDPERKRYNALLDALTNRRVYQPAKIVIQPVEAVANGGGHAIEETPTQEIPISPADLGGVDLTVFNKDFSKRAGVGISDMITGVKNVVNGTANEAYTAIGDAVGKSVINNADKQWIQPAIAKLKEYWPTIGGTLLGGGLGYMLGGGRGAAAGALLGGGLGYGGQYMYNNNPEFKSWTDNAYNTTFNGIKSLFNKSPDNSVTPPAVPPSGSTGTNATAVQPKS